MKIDVKVPAVGESITEAVIGSWNKKNGDYVKMNDVIMSLETDKASVEVVAEKDGLLSTTANVGDTVKIGAVVGTIDTDATATLAASTPATKPAAATAPTPFSGRSAHPDLQSHLSPAVQRVTNERSLDTATISGTGLGGRLTKADVLNANTGPAPSVEAKVVDAKAKIPAVPALTPTLKGPSKQGDSKRVPMTSVRKRIAERLVQAQHTAAILTTFNEVDMTKILELRTK